MLCNCTAVRRGRRPKFATANFELWATCGKRSHVFAEAKIDELEPWKFAPDERQIIPGHNSCYSIHGALYPRFSMLEEQAMIRICVAAAALCTSVFSAHALTPQGAAGEWEGYVYYALLNADTVVIQFAGEPHSRGRGVMFGPDPSDQCNRVGFDPDSANAFQRIREGFARDTSGAVFAGIGSCGDERYRRLCIDHPDVPNGGLDFDTCASVRVIQWDPSLLNGWTLPVPR